MGSFMKFLGKILGITELKASNSQREKPTIFFFLMQIIFSGFTMMISSQRLILMLISISLEILEVGLSRKPSRERRSKLGNVGRTHEYLACDGKDSSTSQTESTKSENFDLIAVYHTAEGGSRGDKAERDIRLLKLDIEEFPKEGRWYFYLANSYKDIGKWDLAIEAYKKRVECGGWFEEVYIAKYELAMCKKYRGDSFEDYMGNLLDAYFFCPERLEALYETVHHAHNNGKHRIGAHLGLMAKNVRYPSNYILFVKRDVHEWKFWEELSICLFFSGGEGHIMMGREILTRV